MASKCHHPCLLQFIGATIDEGGLLLVTELLERSLNLPHFIGCYPSS